MIQCADVTKPGQYGDVTTSVISVPKSQNQLYQECYQCANITKPGEYGDIIKSVISVLKSPSQGSEVTMVGDYTATYFSLTW